MRNEHEITSKLRTNREVRESAIVNSESADTARSLLFSARVSISAISLDAFPSDQRKEAAVQIRKANDAIQRLRNIVGNEPHLLSQMVRSLPREKVQELLSLLSSGNNSAI